MKKQTDIIFEITTAAGLKIKATADHPFLTKTGMRELKYLKKGTQLAVNLFEGVEYEELSDSTLIDEIALPLTRQELNELKKRSLLPLKESNPKLPYLAKLFGYILGDGTIYFSNNKGFVNFYGAENDLKIIQKDLSELGFTGSIYSRQRRHKITSQYGTREFENVTHDLHCNSDASTPLFG